MFETLRLGELTHNFDAARRPVKGTERVSGKYPYYGASGIVDHVDKYLFDGSYLLVAEDGENLRSRSTSVAFMAHGRFWVNNHAHVVQGNDRADSRYLSHLLSITDVSGYLTGSTLPKLTRTALDAILLSVPPVDEQRAIAEVLGALDDKIAANTKVRSTCWGLAEARYWSLRALGIGQVRLGELLSLEYGKSLPSVTREEGNVTVVGSGGIVGCHSSAIVQNSGVVVGRKGTAGAVHWVNGPHWPIDTTYYVRPVSSDISQQYAYFLLASLGLNAMNSDSAVPGLNRAEVMAIKLTVPPARARLEFSTLVAPLIEMATQMEQESAALAELRDTLLPQLMSGKLRVKDAEIAVEGAF